MHGLAESLWLFPVFAQIALAARLLTASAGRQHPLLLCLALCLPAFTLIANLAYGRIGEIAYFHYWIASYLAVCSLIALALTEACTRSLQGYDRFGEAGRRIIRAILIASGMGILTLLFVVSDNAAARFQTYLQAQAHLVQGSLALLGASVWAFAKWARLRLTFNARMTMIVLTLLCAMDGLLGSGISATWGSASFLLGILWSAGLWTYLAVRWTNQPETVRAHRGIAETAEAAPALAEMEAANRHLEDLVRRGQA